MVLAFTTLVSHVQSLFIPRPLIKRLPCLKSTGALILLITSSKYIYFSLSISPLFPTVRLLCSHLLHSPSTFPHLLCPLFCPSALSMHCSPAICPSVTFQPYITLDTHTHIFWRLGNLKERGRRVWWNGAKDKCRIHKDDTGGKKETFLTCHVKEERKKMKGKKQRERSESSGQRGGYRRSR